MEPHWHEILLANRSDEERAALGTKAWGFAVECQSEKVLSLWIDGCDLHAKSQYGMALSEHPFCNGLVPRVAWARAVALKAAQLLASGRSQEMANALLSTSDPTGRSIMDMAIMANHLPLFQATLRAGVDVNVAGARGMTLLHTAASHGRVDIGEALLDLGSDVAAKISTVGNVLGETPLHLAAQSGHRSMCRLLIGRGADAMAMDADGCTPIDVATGRKHGSCADEMQAMHASLLAVRAIEGMAGIRPGPQGACQQLSLWSSP